MMLIEETQVPDAALPVDALKRHLRLSSGFVEDSVQDDTLNSFLRAAIAAIEARTSKALILRGFIWTLHDWRDSAGIALPVGPVPDLTRLTVIDRYGSATIIDPTRYRLETDLHAPRIRPQGSALPTIPSGGSVEMLFKAGFGASFDHVPPDLMQAVLLLAAHYHEYRNETALGGGCMPFGVTALISRYRPVRVGFGA